MILLNGNTILASKRLSAKSTINRKRLYLHSDLGSYAIQNFGDFTIPYGGKDLVVKYLGVFSQSATAQNLLSSYFKLPNLKGNLVNITNQLSFFANSHRSFIYRYLGRVWRHLSSVLSEHPWHKTLRSLSQQYSWDRCFLIPVYSSSVVACLSSFFSCYP